MRPLLESWRGRKFTSEEIAAYDPKKMVGVPCRLALVENGDYVNISSISPLGKSEKCPKQVNAGVFFSLEPDEFDLDVFMALSEKTREKIAKSPEYMALETGSVEPADQDGGNVANDDVGF